MIIVFVSISADHVHSPYPIQSVLCHTMLHRASACQSDIQRLYLRVLQLLWRK